MHLGIISMNDYSTLHRSPELKPHHQMQFSVVLRTPIFLFGGGVIVNIIQAPPIEQEKIEAEYKRMISRKKKKK